MRIHEIIVEDRQLDELTWADVKKGAGDAASAVSGSAKKLAGWSADLAKNTAIGSYNAAKTGARALNTVAGDLATGYDNAGKLVRRVANTTGQTVGGVASTVGNTARQVAGGVRGIGDLARSVGDAASSAAGAVTSPIGGLAGGITRGYRTQAGGGGQGGQGRGYPGGGGQGGQGGGYPGGSGQGGQGGRAARGSDLASMYMQLSKKERQRFLRLLNLTSPVTPPVTP